MLIWLLYPNKSYWGMGKIGTCHPGVPRSNVQLTIMENMVIIKIKKRTNFFGRCFMETAQIIHETGKLPVYQQTIIVEHIIRSIRHAEQNRTLEMAAERLYDDYKNDTELTIFTQLDGEDFYEPR